ncbi:MAG: ROK family protein [Bacteroidales bacterium]|nr:MAG: ROK family protein [Bacteroidales bacterium]
MAVIGLDLGGTKLSGAVFDTTGEMVSKEVRKLEKRKGKEVGKLFRSIIRYLNKIAMDNNSIVTSLGVSVPGISHIKQGTVWAPNIPGWDNYPLREELESFCNTPDIHITIDSDRACSILGEIWKGAAKGCRNAIFLAVGTGIGAGIYVDGKVLRGTDDIAGAIGWFALERPYKEKFRKFGCFEYFASGNGLVRSATEFLKKDEKYNGPLRLIKNQGISSEDIFEAFNHDDPIATKAIRQAIEFWGMAIANLISLFNPEKIILGGGIFGPGARLRDQIVKEASKWAQPVSIHQVSVECSALQSDAALYGAGYLALNK